MSKDKSISFSPRPELSKFESYQPGLSIAQIKRQHGLKKVIKLASNENSLGPSSRALSAYEKCAKDLFRYPETKSVDVRQVVSEKFRVDLSEVIIGAGSDEIIELLAKAFLTPFDEIVVSASAFMQYRAAGHLMGARVTTVPMVSMKHDLKGMAAAVTRQTKFIFIANPNNPTGTYNTRTEVEEFLNKLPAHVIPVFDEAYFEYASINKDYPSMIEEYFQKYPLVVLRTFSKVYGLAGLRVGYGIAPDNLVKAMDKIRPPFNVSVPAQAAAEAALNDTAHIKNSLINNEKEKKYLLKELMELGLTVLPSATNFLLFKTTPWTGRFLFEQLLQKGVIARCVDEYQLPHYLRVTVGLPSENKIFIKALREVLNDQ